MVRGFLRRSRFAEHTREEVNRSRLHSGCSTPNAVSLTGLRSIAFSTMATDAPPAADTVADTATRVAAATLETPTTPLTSAPPPWHAVAAMGCIIAGFVSVLPSWESIDEAAKMENFTAVVFPDLMNVHTIAYIRLLVALSIGYTSFYVAVLSDGWEQITSYLPGSKLVSAPNKLTGIKTMCPFTSLSWNLLGLSFAFNAYIAAQGAAENPVDQWVLRLAVILWEIAAPFTLLVAAVVRYAIWPAVLRTTGKTKELKNWRNVMMHNINVFFALSEAALMGGLRVHWSHFAFAPLVGAFYVLFSWAMVMQWNPQNGAQYIYFFFDTTLPGYTCTISLLVLLAVLTVFYGIFCAFEQVLSTVKSVWTHASFVTAVCAMVMRFDD